MSAILTADWFALGRDTFYRKFEIYCMAWSHDMDLGEMIVCSASYGGPIALVRDRNKFVKIQGQPKPVICIYSASGNLIGSIVWNSGVIVALGWSNREQLICVQEDGSVLLYDMFGAYQHTFSMGQEAKDTKVIDAKVFTSPSDTGLAIMTSSFRIFLINSITEPKIRQLSEIPRASIPPMCWTIVSEDRQTMAIVVRDRELYFLRQDDSHPSLLEPDIQSAYTGVLDMAVSANNKHVALFTDAGFLWIGSASLRTRYCEVDTEHISRPKQLVWCGTEAVIGQWSHTLLVVGKGGDIIHYSYDYNVHLVPEIDGVRVLSGVTHEMIQKVPPVVQKIFRINSTEPGSYLMEASKQFQNRSHRADEYINLVKDQLRVAVEQCIEAAGYEFDPETQKLLIRAAQFGKGFIPNYQPDAYVNMCKLLRVLNAVRDHRVGICITYTQFQHLTSRFLLDRLVMRRQYFLAIEIAKYLNIPESRILAHWACHKVSQSKSDPDTIAQEIAKKLGPNPKGLSYCTIAQKAAETGRKQLAIKLLEHEIHAHKQVPLLLQLGQHDSALHQATVSGDTDLVHTVLLNLRGEMPLAEFQMTIRNVPVAQSLWQKYCLEHNKDALRDIFVQEDDFNSQALYYISESFEPKKSQDTSLSLAQEAFKRARNDVGAAMCDETRKLLRNQRKLEETYKRDFLGRSVHETIKLLLQMQLPKLAENMKSDFKIPDRRYWWLCLECNGELKKWDEIDKLSKLRRSPIGYEPFVDICLKYENRYEAQKYLPKCRDDLKVKYYVRVGLLDEAAQIAFEQKDIQGLEFVQRQCGNQTSLIQKINTYRAQLSLRK